MKKQILAVLFIAPIVAYCQSYEPAFAYHTENIVIDGKLDDWPKKTEYYPISNIGFENLIEVENDLSAHFRIALNKERKSIYLAVEVNDDDVVIEDEENIIDFVDNLYLYLDLTHSQFGSSRNLFQISSKYTDYSGNVSTYWSPYTTNISWKDIDYKITQAKNSTIYECEIFLRDDFKLNSVIGFDLIVADIDSKEEEEWLTWKNGTSKSANSTRLGELVLVENQSNLGYLEGKIDELDTSFNNVKSIVITSVENPTFWIRANVDSLGHYEIKLPKGHYEMKPEIVLTSPLYSSGFKQKSRKIDLASNKYFTIKPNDTTITNVRLHLKQLPLGLFEEQGVLFQESFDQQKIDDFVKIMMDYYEIPGVSLALIHDNKIVYNSVFGVKNTLTNESLNKSTLFEGASITKTVFALMALKLAEKGDLDLDKPLYNYLRFPNIEHNDNYQKITARHVLNHQTGLDNWPVGAYAGYLSDNKADLEFEPGSDFKYSGEAFNYLGRVVEHITEKSLSQLFEEEIASSFNMTSTDFSYSDSLESKISLGHYHKLPNFKDKFKGVDSPASSLMTNANDFSKFVLGLLNEKYLSPESYELIYEPHQIISDSKKLYDVKIKQGISHGFFIGYLPEGKMIMHGGNNGDFDCKYGFMPTKKIGYVVFTNSNLGDEFIRLLELYLFRGEKSLSDIDN